MASRPCSDYTMWRFLEFLRAFGIEERTKWITKNGVQFKQFIAAMIVSENDINEQGQHNDYDYFVNIHRTHLRFIPNCSQRAEMYQHFNKYHGEMILIDEELDKMIQTFRKNNRNEYKPILMLFSHYQPCYRAVAYYSCAFELSRLRHRYNDLTIVIGYSRRWFVNAGVHRPNRAYEKSIGKNNMKVIHCRDKYFHAYTSEHLYDTVLFQRHTDSLLFCDLVLNARLKPKIARYHHLKYIRTRRTKRACNKMEELLLFRTSRGRDALCDWEY